MAVRTSTEEDYAIYKEALNQATAEIRHSKRSYEQKIAFNIKHDSKSFYAYVRSKQKVQDKVGPLEGSDGNIITEGFLTAENLNEYFSSVFTREDISTLPVLETKFEGREYYHISYEMRLKECGLTTLETRRLRGYHIEVLKILNGYENIDRNIFVTVKEERRTRGHGVTLAKKQCRLDIRQL